MKTAKNETNVLPYGEDFWRSLNSKTTIYDLIYNPAPTPLLQLGNKKRLHDNQWFRNAYRSRYRIIIILDRWIRGAFSYYE